MATKGYLRRNGATRLVGAEDVVSGYRGTWARVDVDWKGGWLNICADDYEGNVMLNIEALPYLIKALREIEKERKAQTRK